MPLADLCHHCNHSALLNALTLSLVDPKTTQALAAPASNDLRIELCAPEVPWTADHTDHLLAIWPWIPPALKPWLRNYVAPLLSDDALIPFVAIDPAWLCPSDTQGCKQMASVVLWQAIHETTPLSIDAIMHVLNYAWHHKVFAHATVTMVRYADPATLRSIYQRTFLSVSQLLLLAPQAPEQLVRTIVRQLRLKYTEVGVEPDQRGENPLRVLLAPIDLQSVTLSSDPRKALLALGAWAHYPLAKSPQMRLTMTPKHETLLANAAHGAYADVVTLIADRLPSKPTAFTPCPFPRTAGEAKALCQNTDASTAERAVAFRAGAMRFHRAPRTCLAMPSPTSSLDPAWAKRLSLHSDVQVRLHLATHSPLPADVISRLLRDKSIDVSLQALGHPHTTDAQAKVFLRRVRTTDLLMHIPMVSLTIAATQRLTAHRSEHVHSLLVIYQPITSALRARFLHDKRPWMRACIAKRKDLTREDIVILTSQPLNIDIAEGLVSNPLTPSETISRIATRWGRLFRDQILAHPHATDAVRVTAAIA